MGKKRILIVDDEESVRSVLRNSLQKSDSSYEVTTAADGFTAVSLLQEESFDLVVTDYKMTGMDGLELLEAIQTIRPQTRVILITAYGSTRLEQEAQRLQAYRYLAKPLEIDAFREIVKEALGDVAVSRPGFLILSDNRYREVMEMLDLLREDVGARCILLTDASGRLIARTGDIRDLNSEELASLLGGSIASMLEIGRVLEDNNEAINLAYREGKKEYLYAINIGHQILLILLIERQPYSSRLGSVWYYAQQTALTLRQKLGDAEFANPPQIFSDSDVDLAFEAELDKLLLEDDLIGGSSD